LERAGLVPSGVDSAAHHLVGFAEADATAQAVLNRFGMSTNEAANGMWLTVAEHQLTYGNAYKECLPKRRPRSLGRDTSILVVWRSVG
jgi:hypothetical protein